MTDAKHFEYHEVFADLRAELRDQPDPAKSSLVDAILEGRPAEVVVAPRRFREHVRHRVVNHARSGRSIYNNNWGKKS